MQKVYSKFTKDRRIQFQIETYIAEENGKRLVAKRALTEQAKSHVYAMREFYENFESRKLLCPARMLDDSTIAFSFLKGQSLCKEMLGALENQDKDAFNGYLTYYNEIVRRLVDNQGEKNADANSGGPGSMEATTQAGSDAPEQPAFKDTATFVEVFGNANIDGLETSNLLDIDLTFDNIIHVTDEDTMQTSVGDSPVNHYQIIDYEWIFPFEVPVNYAIYRAISAFYMKYAAVMQGLVTVEEMYDLFLITPEQVAVYAEMNRNFDNYVYGMYGAHQIERKYEHETYELKKLIPEQNLFTQLFWKTGKGYSEEQSVSIPVERPSVDLVIPVDELLDERAEKAGNKNGNDLEIKEFRLDPLNVSGLISNVTLEVLLDDKRRVTVKNYHHNGILTKKGQLLFAHEDPQFKFPNIWGDHVDSILLKFDIDKAGMAEDPILPYLAERKSFKEKIKKLLK